MNDLGNLLGESDALEAPSRANKWGRFLGGDRSGNERGQGRGVRKELEFHYRCCVSECKD
eukprot:CAMPEP_0201874106 /NCGR_PEP_ID=MMETSP0902-20130614/6454_1 /ASSEMBLY_ACC=CAM_ASM_000551 /TAXON_ID=420261 /ORGANISM="Thalassiosira antarctica, Strain CCMP982" /LENGTH=59 /DNA_ID=CAMNT_0048400895 /DNA_START=156 /DNA_END=332 /DNA_ORIENTATION=-